MYLIQRSKVASNLYRREGCKPNIILNVLFAIQCNTHFRFLPRTLCQLSQVGQQRLHTWLNSMEDLQQTKHHLRPMTIPSTKPLLSLLMAWCQIMSMSSWWLHWKIWNHFPQLSGGENRQIETNHQDWLLQSPPNWVVSIIPFIYPKKKKKKKPFRRVEPPWSDSGMCIPKLCR